MYILNGKRYIPGEVAVSKMQPEKILISLHKCAGCSEFLLGAQVQRNVFSYCCGLYCIILKLSGQLKKKGKFTLNLLWCPECGQLLARYYLMV